jgi:chemotaxis protein MotB
MGKCKKVECPECLPEWLAAFGDLMSLLLTFFILLLSMATMDAVKIREAIGSFKGSLGILPGSEHMEADEEFSISQSQPLDSENTSEGLDEMKEPIAEVNQIFSSMNQDIVTITESEDGFVMRLPSKLLFDGKNADIRYEDAKLFIKRISMIIRKMPNKLNIEIRGHTDNIEPIGTKFADNWELSSARAIAVLKAMIKEGINKRRLHASGYADTKPVSSNKTTIGRNKNKRVDIYFFTDKDYENTTKGSKFKKSILDMKK